VRDLWDLALAASERMEFNEAEHRYMLDGVELPSVSRIMAPITELAFAKIPRATLERKIAIGHAVHLASTFIDADALDEDSVDPAISGYLDGYRLFLQEKRPTYRLSETRLAHPLYRYAGTPDRLATIDGLTGPLDLKSTVELYPHVGIQLAGYELLLESNGFLADVREGQFARFALQLTPDGKYRLRAYESTFDAPAFMGLLAVHRWSSQHGK
jgi:hypothetical protein